MTPTSFDFTVTMPGDARLAGAARQLAAHAAGYAQLTPEASEGLVGQVERAAEAAMAAAPAAQAFLEFRFSRDARAIDVVISAPAAPSARIPGSHAGAGLAVDWTHEGARCTCHIRQLTAD